MGPEGIVIGMITEVTEVAAEAGVGVVAVAITITTMVMTVMAMIPGTDESTTTMAEVVVVLEDITTGTMTLVEDTTHPQQATTDRLP